MAPTMPEDYVTPERKADAYSQFAYGMFDAVDDKANGIGTLFKDAWESLIGTSNKYIGIFDFVLRTLYDLVVACLTLPKTAHDQAEYITGELLSGDAYRAGYATGTILLIFSDVLITKAIAEGLTAVAEKFGIIKGKVVESGSLTAEEFVYKYVPKDNRAEVLSGFVKGDIKVTTLTKDTMVYRYYGGEAQPVGRWVTPNKVSNPKSVLALPAENTAEFVNTLIIPKGTTILEGTVADNFGYKGGGYQYYVVDPSVMR